MAQKLRAGFEWNPLKAFPRNNPCFCGSAKKAKACCIPQLSETMFTQDANTVRSLWDGLIDGTETLQFKIAAAPTTKADPHKCQA